MPTTHEFGPRGAYGDWEWHEELATRFGMSYVDSPEQSFRSSERQPREHHAAPGRQRQPVRDRRAGARRHDRERRLPGARGRRRPEVQGHLPAGRVLPALARQLRRRRPAAGQRDQGHGLLRAGRVLPDQAEARALRHHLADLRRRRRRLRRQLRVRHRHELVSVPDAQPPAQPAAARRQQVAGQQHLRLLHRRPGRLDAGVVVLDLLLRRSSHADATRSFMRHDALRLPLGGNVRALAALPLASGAGPGRSVAATYLFHDAHFHLTNYVQQGTDIRKYLRDHGRQGRPLDAVRHPAAADLVVRELGRLRADLLPAVRRAALLLLVHRRLHRDRVPEAHARAAQARSTR